MDLTSLESLVAKRAGLSVDQDKDDIDSAISGAMAEYGVHVDVPAAQKTESIAIAASSNYINAPTSFSEIKSAVYRYALGSDYATKSLTGSEIADIDKANEGLEGYETDNITAFAVYEDKIYVGPGKVSTGGTLIIRYQVPLDLSHLSYINNPMAIRDGAVANLLPDDNPKYEPARKAFIAAWQTEGAAAQPIQQNFSEVSLPANILADDYYRSQL